MFYIVTALFLDRIGQHINKQRENPLVTESLGIPEHVRVPKLAPPTKPPDRIETSQYTNTVRRLSLCKINEITIKFQRLFSRYKPPSPHAPLQASTSIGGTRAATNAHLLVSALGQQLHSNMDLLPSGLRFEVCIEQQQSHRNLAAAFRNAKPTFHIITEPPPLTNVIIGVIKYVLYHAIATSQGHTLQHLPYFVTLHLMHVYL